MNHTNYNSFVIDGTTNIKAKGGCLTATKTPAVSEGLQRTRNLIDEITDLFRGFEAQLSPVLVPCPPSPQPSAPYEAIVGGDVAQMLGRFVGDLNDLAIAMRAVKSRLEI